DKQRGHPDGALFCLAEFASLLSLRLLHPPGQNRAWLGTPNLHPTARSARWGPRAYGVWNCPDVPLTQALSLIALCATRERTWANFFRAYGAAFSRVTQLCRSRCIFEERVW